ncbi:MAG: hypothetical protein KIH63_005555 [Candidatus Saccharibacteria bacterium]|nr:hypothetical protein [Candidatus Saccharibacteria bacterium]
MARPLGRLPGTQVPVKTDGAEASVEVYQPGDGVSTGPRSGLPDVARFDAEAFSPDDETGTAPEAGVDIAASPAEAETTASAAATDVATAAHVDLVDNGFGDEDVTGPGGSRDADAPLLGGVWRAMGRSVRNITTLASDREAQADGDSLDDELAETPYTSDGPAAEAADDSELAADIANGAVAGVEELDVSHDAVVVSDGHDEGSNDGQTGVAVSAADQAVVIPTLPGLDEVNTKIVSPEAPRASVVAAGPEAADAHAVEPADGATGGSAQQGIAAHPDLGTRNDTMPTPVIAKATVPGEPLLDRTQAPGHPVAAASGSETAHQVPDVSADLDGSSNVVPFITKKQRRELERQTRQAEVEAAAAERRAREAEQLAQFRTKELDRMDAAVVAGLDRRHLGGGEPYTLLGTNAIGELQRISRCAILANLEVRTGVAWDETQDPTLRQTELAQVQALVGKAYQRATDPYGGGVNMAQELSQVRRERVMRDVELAVDSATEAAERTVLPGIYVGIERHLVPAIEARRGANSTKPVLSPAEALKKHAEDAALKIIDGAHIRREGHEPEAYIVDDESREVVVRNGYFVDPEGNLQHDPDVAGIYKLIDFMGFDAWQNNTSSGRNLQAEALHQPANTTGGYVAIQSFRSARFGSMAPSPASLPSGRDPESLGLAVPSAKGVDTTIKGYVEVVLDARQIYPGPFNQLLEGRNDELKGRPIARQPVLPHIAGELLLRQAHVISETLDGIEQDRQTAEDEALALYNLRISQSQFVRTLGAQMGLTSRVETPAIGTGSLRDYPDLPVSAGHAVDSTAHTNVVAEISPNATLAELAGGQQGIIDMDMLATLQAVNDRRGLPISIS